MVKTTDILAAVIEALNGIEDKIVKEDLAGAHEDITQTIDNVSNIMATLEKARENKALKEKLELKRGVPDV